MNRNRNSSSDQYDVESIESSEYTYTDSIASKDTLDDLLERFTLDFSPEMALKVRTRVGPLVVGADASRFPHDDHISTALVIKPVNRDQWWRRLRMDSSGLITLRSRKLQWWVFTLSLEGHANPLQRTSNMSFRCATKWDLSRGEYRNKKRFSLNENAEARMHWSVSYDLPEIAGSFGASGSGANAVSRDMHADPGFAHGEVSKLELVLWPMKNKPTLLEIYPEKPIKGVSSSSVSKEEVVQNEQQASSSNSNNNNNNNASTTNNELNEHFNAYTKKNTNAIQNFVYDLVDNFEGFVGSLQIPERFSELRSGLATLTPHSNGGKSNGTSIDEL